MIFSLKSLILNNKLLVPGAGIAGLLLAFGFGGASAQAPAMPNIIDEIIVAAQPVSGTDANSAAGSGCITIVPFYQEPISQATFLKYEKTACSDQDADVAKTVTKKINVLLTAYSSTPEETDDTPFVTANGTYVYDGVIANNMLPFGTKVRIPDLYGNKVFSVEDRMHWRKSDYHFDIWMPSNGQAKNFGVKYAYLEILK